MKYILFFILIITISSSAHYEYRKATTADIPQLLMLINAQTKEDSKKIVILPKNFRAASLKNSIQKGHIFVAIANETQKEAEEKHQKEKQSSANDSSLIARVVGYKKLYLLTDATEKNNILTDELRCTDPSKVTFAGSINTNTTTMQKEKIKPSEEIFDLCIYNGADFTTPDYRGKGINKKLTDAALEALETEVKKNLGIKKTVTMIYGITQANAGFTPGDKNDRTIAISKSFSAFVEKLQTKKSQEVVTLQHFRYPSFMPTFDPEAAELKPLSDEYAISGYGCVLTCQIK